MEQEELCMAGFEHMNYAHGTMTAMHAARTRRPLDARVPGRGFCGFRYEMLGKGKLPVDSP